MMNVKLERSSETQLKKAIEDTMNELRLTANRLTMKGHTAKAREKYKKLQDLAKVIDYAYGLTKIEVMMTSMNDKKAQ